MKKYQYSVEAIAYDKDGKRLNGNNVSVHADSDSEAEKIAAQGQKWQVGTAKVETRIIYKREK